MTKNTQIEAAQIIADALNELSLSVESTSPNTDSFATGQSLTEAMMTLAINIGRIANVMENQSKTKKGEN
jgi:hypothetical protein